MQKQYCDASGRLRYDVKKQKTNALAWCCFGIYVHFNFKWLDI